jgi:hypothetical protein
MTITFDNDKDVIVYALERVISYARRTQQIFAAQCIWWLASIVGLENELVSYIDKLHRRTVVEDPVRSRTDTFASRELESKSAEPIEERQDKVLKECEEYLQESQRVRNTLRPARVDKVPDERIISPQSSDILEDPQTSCPSVTAQIGMGMFRDKGGRFLAVSKELCYGKAETLEDAEEGARGWRYNLVR